jgi:1-deoxy-D-xylulose-5-phosphate synthase
MDSPGTANQIETADIAAGAVPELEVRGHRPPRAAGKRRTPSRREALARLLDTLESPQSLRELPEARLGDVACALRELLLHAVSTSGGHLASSLGTVELTIALHYLYDTPHDALVWDVGHQAYAHKALTGRRDELERIRRSNGPSGFLRRSESAYDVFGAGHSSTSISAALGLALAARATGVARRSVAIIGDGALTGGMAFEALDHAGATGADLLVVLNDNGMSISENVGALNDSLRQRRASPRRGGAHSQEVDSIEGFFATLGFSCSAPIDGHDLPSLLQNLREQRARRGPRVLHVVTRKGHGYAPAVTDPIRYHGVVPFDPRAGLPPTPANLTYTQIFGQWLCDRAELRSDLVAITPAMREGSGLVRFSQLFPHRYHDVGIAEQHAVTLAAGLACGGMRPVVAIYSTFLQRAYDQLIHDVALQGLPVVFAVDRAGAVGPDGATHNGSFDLAFMRCVPGLTIMTPSGGAELRAMLDLALTLRGPSAVRYPRANVAAADAIDLQPPCPGRSVEVRSGKRVAILAFGTLLHEVAPLARELDATLIDMRFVAPLDVDAVRRAAARHALLVTIEEHVVAGGAGSAVNECLAAHGQSASILNLGLPARFTEHGTRDEVLHSAGLDAVGIRKAITDRLAALGTPRSPASQYEVPPVS